MLLLKSWFDQKNELRCSWLIKDIKDYVVLTEAAWGDDMLVPNGALTRQTEPKDYSFGHC